MGKPRQHWLPAAVIGSGFGDRGSGPGREAVVGVRRKRSAGVELVKASTVCYERGLYTLAAPPVGVDANVVDRVLGTIEPVIPAVITSLETGDQTADGEEILLDYAAMLGSRHPQYFREIVGAHTSRIGAEPLAGDAVTLARLQVLQNALEQVRQWHWRVVDSPIDAPGFVLNDRGFSYVGQEQRPSRALFIPLSRRVAVLGFGGQQTGFASRFTATSMSVRWLNALTWTDAPLEAYAHPFDREMLANLADPTDAPANSTGPYRGSTRNLLDE